MSLRSACGCTWERRAGYGDVIIVRCIKHAAASRTPSAKRARAAADALVRRLRDEGKVR
jgi:hypothetical protein